jgi:hypothetical protein
MLAIEPRKGAPAGTGSPPPGAAGHCQPGPTTPSARRCSPAAPRRASGQGAADDRAAGAHRPAGARPTPNWIVRAWAVRALPDKNVRISGVPGREFRHVLYHHLTIYFATV